MLLDYLMSFPALALISAASLSMVSALASAERPADLVKREFVASRPSGGRRLAIPSRGVLPDPRSGA